MYIYFGTGYLFKCFAVRPGSASAAEFVACNGYVYRVTLERNNSVLKTVTGHVPDFYYLPVGLTTYGPAH